LSGEGRVEGGRTERGTVAKATKAFFGATMALRGTGKGTREASYGKRAGFNDRRTEADENGLLVSIPGETEADDKGAEGANMSMKHSLLLSSGQMQDAPWEKPFLHADPSCHHANPRRSFKEPILLSPGEHSP
jgi:hypothetical protein